MSKRLETIWPIDPHTSAKHAILRRYWQAWLPIMTTWSERVLYIDGFAGPGKYKGGEDGSPLIALKAARDHPAKPRAEIVFIFIEKDEARFRHLEQTVQEIKPSLPKNFVIQCVHGVFNEEMTKVFKYLDEQKKKLAPSLVFIDPFGFKHTPFQTIERIVQNPRCEVLITFMYEEMNRFLGDAKFTDTYDDLFGTQQWREALGISDPDARRRKLHDTYLEQLERAARIKYVRSFQMLNKKNCTDYFLFFGSNELLGLQKMKEAMWKVDPIGTYQFSDFTHAARLVNLFPDEPDYALLKELILVRFKGAEASVEEIGDYIVAETPFLRSHFKKQILRPMEEEGELLVIPAKSSRRAGTFPDGTRLRFK